MTDTDIMWNTLPAVVTTYLSAHRVQRLDGDFPGGVADLHYRFTLADGLISRLAIEP